MKMIINNLLYDTESSTLIHEDIDRGRRYYKTANGNYFGLYGASKIIPMSEESMKKLLGEEDVEKYIELFDTPEMA